MNLKLIGLVAALAVVAGCKKEKTAEAPPAPPVKEAGIDAKRLAAFGALPARIDGKEGPASDAMVDLGRNLYYDTRLSKNHDLSCNSCHELSKYGVDGQAFSPGHKGQLGGRNSPTVYNAAGRHAQFWDGRAADVEEQALGPVMNPVEMAMPDESRVLETLRSIPAYVEAFAKAFPKDEDPVSFVNMGKAIGAFERGLVTPSRWDLYLAGDEKALTGEEQEGLKVFVATGCTACHAGTYVGGAMFQKLGLVKPWPSEKDLGRFTVTQAKGDEMMFSVPTLRNIAETGPYFHDGSVEKLDEAVRLMARHQLGKELAEGEVKSIVAFLGALTGEIPTEYIAKPELPASTDKTPKPDPT